MSKAASTLKIGVDTGGTFTDLVVDDGAGQIHLSKSLTTPDDPVRGVFDVLAIGAERLGYTLEELLLRSSHFIHGTTRATNAIITQSTAKTALLTTEGHPDILVFREGGRTETFDWSRPYPKPYVPRRLTFEVRERIGSEGEIVVPLSEGTVIEAIQSLRALQVEAVAVSLLWSIVNPIHEVRIGELLQEHLPTVPFSLSHALNPTMREYRRTSATAIDASLKPLMSDYLRRLASRLREQGFAGRVLVVTSRGGMLDATAVADAPIHSVGSGPAMAPVAGRYFAQLDGNSHTAVVADTGGTSYDVSIVRRGTIPQTRETWLGSRFFGHMTGFASIDVKSVGAGGGSIAWVDDGGLLHVGPESAGSTPGPACYSRGGNRPTVTDACLVLGYIDPSYFLSGGMTLDVVAARRVVTDIAQALGTDEYSAASAVLRVATEHMAQAIEEITINQGIDPRNAVLIGGGGAAGLNVVAIARRLDFPRVILPEVGAALSAAGGLISPLSTEFAVTRPMASNQFDFAACNRALSDLRERCREFADQERAHALSSAVECWAEARYPQQNWEIDVPLTADHFDAEALDRFRNDFHARHQEIFAISDPQSPVEVVSWHARINCDLHATALGKLANRENRNAPPARRDTYFADYGHIQSTVVGSDELTPGRPILGPLIVECPLTTVVVDPGASVEMLESGSLSIRPHADKPRVPRKAHASAPSRDGVTP